MKKMIAQLEVIFSSRKCLTGFWKKIDKMKHFNYIFYQITYTVKLIEATFGKHIQQPSAFLFQMLDFAIRQEVALASQRLVLLEQRSPYTLLHRVSGFSADPSISK